MLILLRLHLLENWIWTHERPYRLQWLNDYGEVRVTKWVLISFSIIKYKDDVLCDVVPIHATHLLLRRPWQFNRKAKHDEFKNMYSLKEDSKKFTLVPLSPKQMWEDQLKLKGESKAKKKINHVRI
jgi:hypothetical protein